MSQSDFFVSIAEARRRAGNIGRTTLYRWAADGRFPAIHKIGPKRAGVLESELNRWIQSRPVSLKLKEKVA
jgi:predicted DNA-binding transcriptional regulator AlpA